jgi:hypothetical protein
MTRELHDQFNALNDPRQRGVPTATVVRPARHDDKIFRSRVAIALKMLHEQKTEAFAQQTSFGFRRVPLIGYSDLYPAERPIVSLPEQPLLVSPENQYYEKPKNVLAWEADVREHYPKYLHLSMYFQFGRDEWYSPQRGYARGFSPHAAVSTVRWDYDVYRAPVQPEWQVMQLELVSLLKFDDYRVYISDKLPNMSELVDADTRPLDSFETVSLGALFEGEFIVAQESPNEMRLLGAVRAAEKCIDCHSVKPGELLGAFSYRLQRVASEPSNGEVIGGK